MLTVSQAAKEVGITRGGLWKAIKDGRLSATKNNKGQFCIDPAELFRVYPPVDTVGVHSKQASIDKRQSRQHEADELRLRLELTNRLLAKAESEVDDLRRRLDDESSERRKLIQLLTHQPEQQAQPEPKQEGSLLWRKLFGRH
jgi:hypothetical protein